MEFATNARALGGFVRWMTRDTDSQQTDRTAKVPLSGAQAAALLRIGGEPMRETERADGGTNGVIVGAAAHGVCAFLRTVPSFGCIEIGHVAFAPVLRRTTAATEAIA